MPAERPVTTPVDEPTVAMAGVDELHVPPGSALLNVVELPAQATKMPVMGAMANAPAEKKNSNRKAMDIFFINFFPGKEMTQCEYTKY
jgi:hypothetical protein